MNPEHTDFVASLTGEPFAGVPQRVLERLAQLPVNGAAFRVGLCIVGAVYRFRSDGGRAKAMTYDILSAGTGLHRATVHDALVELQSRQVITISGRRGRVANVVGVRDPSEWVLDDQRKEKATVISRHVPDGYQSPRTRRLNSRHMGEGLIRNSKNSDSQAIQEHPSTLRGPSTPVPLNNPQGTPGLEAAVGVRSSKHEVLSKVAGSGALTVLVPRRDSLSEHARRFRELKAVNEAATGGQ
jgi:hypothetical protein